MAELIRHKHVPRDCRLVLTSDQHWGAKACHYDAFHEMVEFIRANDDVWWLHNGDFCEGKPTRSKHFDPNTLRPDMITLEQQMDGFREAIRPIADKCLYYGYGNHCIYVMPDLDVVRWLTESLGIDHVRGGYQGTCDLGHTRIFLYHGRRNMPRGAKDPIQRRANQQAWLKRTLEGLHGNSHLMVLGHVHALHVVEPQVQLALLNRGTSMRARHFVAPTQTVTTEDPVTGKKDVRHYIPPDSRWYCISGTFRRSGGVGYLDYAEIGGYEPSLIGYQLVTIRDGAIQSVEPQVI